MEKYIYKNNNLLKIILLILIIDFFIHDNLFKNIGDIKHKLTFNLINYPIISLIMLLIIILFNKNKDYHHFKKLFHEKYFNKYKKLMNEDGYNKMVTYINNYIQNICYLHYTKLVPNVYVYSMLSLEGLENIENSTKAILNNNINGDFVECGVWRGGTGIIIKKLLQKYNNSNKQIFLLDSYEGMENLEKSNSLEETDKLDELCSNILNDAEKYFGKKLIETNYDEVKNNLKHFGCYDDKIILLKGWFNNEFPFDNINTISLLRLDCDYYYPTKICLEKLYNKISKGGFIILDEYYLEFMGEKNAVDEFRSKNNITSKLIPVDNNIAYWIKE
jgi:O-methyltransferase/8-demethyl-8-(2,3-dimethoxy-alpha-L-rhamnosyl)tetracenomycin-C 4'-O-methyltransferase